MLIEVGCWSCLFQSSSGQTLWRFAGRDVVTVRRPRPGHSMQNTLSLSFLPPPAMPLTSHHSRFCRRRSGGPPHRIRESPTLLTCTFHLWLTSGFHRGRGVFYSRYILIFCHVMPSSLSWFAVKGSSIQLVLIISGIFVNLNSRLLVFLLNIFPDHGFFHRNQE